MLWRLGHRGSQSVLVGVSLSLNISVGLPNTYNRNIDESRDTLEYRYV